MGADWQRRRVRAEDARAQSAESGRAVQWAIPYYSNSAVFGAEIAKCKISCKNREFGADFRELSILFSPVNATKYLFCCVRRLRCRMSCKSDFVTLHGGKSGQGKGIGAG